LASFYDFNAFGFEERNREDEKKNEKIGKK